MSSTMREDEIHGDVVTQLIASTPEWWDRVILELICSSSDGIEKCEHTIHNPADPSGPVLATDELMAATRALTLFYKEQGTPFSKAVYEAFIRDDEQWGFKVDFTYPDPA